MKKIANAIRRKARGVANRVSELMLDRRGELATNTIGSIIIAVVIVGLLIVAINSFFPGFFTNMFNNMSDKLNANW